MISVKKCPFRQSSGDRIHSSTFLFLTMDLYTILLVTLLTFSSSSLPLVVLGSSSSSLSSHLTNQNTTNDHISLTNYSVSSHNNWTLTVQTKATANKEVVTTTLTLPLLSQKKVIERFVRERRFLIQQHHELDFDYDYDLDKDYNEYLHGRNLRYPFGKLYQGIGTHYVDLWVGTPHPQRQTVIVDTGSGVTAFPCEPCQDCGSGYHTDNEYRILESTSFSYETCGQCSLGKCKQTSTTKMDNGSESSSCEISKSYSEGSKWKGREARDLVYIGGSHNKEEEEEEAQDGKRFLTNVQDEFNNHPSQTKDRNLRAMHKETKIMEDEFRKKAKEVEEEYQTIMERENNHAVSAKDFAFELKFGCQYMITGLFKTQLADGVMGMEDSDTAFWKQMYNAGKISSKAFSLCYSHSDYISRNGTDAGVMTLGGSNPNLHQSPMVYAEYVEMDGWYGVHVSAIYLKSNGDGNTLNDNDNVDNDDDEKEKTKLGKLVKLDLDIKELNSDGIIVDSGTTDSIFPTMVYKPFQKAFKELLGFDFIERVPLKNDQDLLPPRDYPTILIQLKAARNVQDHELMDVNGHPLQGLAHDLDMDAPNDVILEIPAEQYMTWSERSKKYKNRFRMDDDSGGGIIGANGMIGHDILFDVENNRIGVAKSDCVLKE